MYSQMLTMSTDRWRVYQIPPLCSAIGNNKNINAVLQKRFFHLRQKKSEPIFSGHDLERIIHAFITTWLYCKSFYVGVSQASKCCCLFLFWNADLSTFHLSCLYSIGYHKFMCWLINVSAQNIWLDSRLGYINTSCKCDPNLIFPFSSYVRHIQDILTHQS